MNPSLFSLADLRKRAMSPWTPTKAEDPPLLALVEAVEAAQEQAHYHPDSISPPLDDALAKFTPYEAPRPPDA